MRAREQRRLAVMLAVAAALLVTWGLERRKAHTDRRVQELERQLDEARKPPPSPPERPEEPPPEPRPLRAVSEIIDPTKRAVTIPFDNVGVLGGFLQQGDFVDVLATITVPGGNPVTRVVLQRVRVLIVGRSYREEDDQPGDPTRADATLRLVTFEVTPEEAEKLVLASRRFPLTLTLRNPTAELSPEEAGKVADSSELFPERARPEARRRAEPKQPQHAEVILGHRKQMSRFPLFQR